MLGALFVHLGLWQAGKANLSEAQRLRYEQRAHLPPQKLGAAMLAAQQVQDGTVVVEGQYEPADQFFVDNRQEDGRPGIHVITPLKIKDSDTHVLVNRGWVAWPDRRTLPVVPVPQGLVRVMGVASVPLIKQPFLISAERQEMPRLWFAPDIARYGQQHSYPVQPVLILENPHDVADGLVRHWSPPEDRTAMHRGYALQWFAMTAGLCTFFLWSSIKRKPVP